MSLLYIHPVLVKLPVHHPIYACTLAGKMPWVVTNTSMGGGSGAGAQDNFYLLLILFFLVCIIYNEYLSIDLY